MRASRPMSCRRSIRACGIVLLALAATPAGAQQLVTSPGPDDVAVTLYRAPQRAPDEAIDRADPAGFALITETRRVALPAGRATIRFEGVAGNIFAESAILSGLPQDVREKNLDADLLSPRSLYDRALGRRVMIRRTNPATGRVGEEQAIIRSGAGGAAVLQTAGGFTDLRCSGLPETLVYDGVPSGLSAKPTLSIETDSAAANSAVLTLSYLAGGFDWQADYVVRMRPDGRGADLFAWITLASSDVTSFVGAGTQVVAGKPNRDSSIDFGTYRAGQLALKCWELPDYAQARATGAPPPPPPPPPSAPPAPVAMSAVSADIVVTGMRIARQEELGDFKLYRIADPVTVASRAQKQVALLSKDAVPLTALYVGEIFEGDIGDPVLTLRGRNRPADGLGVPLPAGQVVVFETVGGRPMLAGEGSIDDKAVGEDVEFKLGERPGVTSDGDTVDRDGRTARYTLTVTNDTARDIVYEARITARSGAAIRGRGVRLGTRDGRTIWTATVPANGAASLRYEVRAPRGG